MKRLLEKGEVVLSTDLEYDPLTDFGPVKNRNIMGAYCPVNMHPIIREQPKPDWRVGKIPNPEGRQVLCIERFNEDHEYLLGNTKRDKEWEKIIIYIEDSCRGYTPNHVIENKEDFDCTGRWFIQNIYLPE